MVTREIIKGELDRVPEDRLEEVYEVVKLYSRSATQTSGSSIFAKLRTISIEGPEDFADRKSVV